MSVAYHDLDEVEVMVEENGVRASERSRSRVGLVDLGSNSCRLVVANIDAHGRVTVLNRVKTMVRLGEGSFANKTLQPEAMARTLKALSAFAHICEGYGVDVCEVLGTAALRNAQNRDEFVARVKETCGLDVKVISGIEEASLIRQGVFAGLGRIKRPICLIDIGGGSTEISVSDRREVFMMESLALGCVLVKDEFEAGPSGRVSAKTLEKMYAFVRARARHSVDEALKAGFDRVLASSGTAQALVNLAQGSRIGVPGEVREVADGRAITLTALKAVVTKLARMSLSERAALPGVSEARSQVVLQGGVILVTLLEALGAEEITVTERNLQDGQLVDWIERHGGGLSGEENLRRKKSVKRLAKRFHSEKRHAKHVKRISRALLKSASDAGFVKLGETDAELLGYAAKLHDIGIDIAYTEHGRLGAWLVLHTGLEGFTEEECLKLARLVYWHNRPGDELPAELAGGAIVTEADRWCALSLGLAEKLDRTHRGVVYDAHWERGPKGEPTLVVASSAEADMERDAAEKLLRKQGKKLAGASVSLIWTAPEEEQKSAKDHSGANA